MFLYVDFFVVPGAPEFVRTDISASSVVLSWDEPQVSNGIIVSYTVFYNLTGGNVSIIVDVLSGRRYVVSELVAYTYYEFVITAETKIGSGPTTTIVIQTSESSKL